MTDSVMTLMMYGIRIGILGRSKLANFFFFGNFREIQRSVETSFCSLINVK